MSLRGDRWDVSMESRPQCVVIATLSQGHGGDRLHVFLNILNDKGRGCVSVCVCVCVCVCV